MNDQQHPVTPPPELVRQWTEATRYKKDMPYPEGYEQCEQRLCTTAAQWGADQELQACINFVYDNGLCDPHFYNNLRTARRPKPPSLKEQALERLMNLEQGTNPPGFNDYDTIRRALEQLND
jgi:hypothetical protein